MIHDALDSSVHKYARIHPLFAVAFEYLAQHRAELNDPAFNGRHEINGEDLFVMVGEHRLKPAEDTVLEAHDKYIDLQVMIDGGESFGWARRNACSQQKGGFDEGNDIVFYNDEPTSRVTAKKGEFVIFFPEDAHAPLGRPEKAEEEAVSRKAIVKIRVEAR